MNAKITQSSISGCYEICPEKSHDERGSFIKVFHKNFFIQNNLDYQYLEEYYSISKKGVLRGLHFQSPPFDHTKVVYCVDGCVFDAVLDLRKNSATYGKHDIFTLDSKKSNMLYIPSGIAHGFYVLSQKAIMIYKVSNIYSPKHDSGILWNSANIPWPNKDPIVSNRDSTFIKLENYNSSF